MSGPGGGLQAVSRDEVRKTEPLPVRSTMGSEGAWRPSGPPLADERGHARSRRHEAGTGTQVSGQLATLG
jgi:hypothetical protein